MRTSSLGFFGQGGEEGAESDPFGTIAAWLRVEQGVSLEGPVQQVDGVFGVAHRVLGHVEIGRHV